MSRAAASRFTTFATSSASPGAIAGGVWAGGAVRVSAAASRQIRGGTVARGDRLPAARLAGIMAAKQTASLIPLCHPLPLSHVSVEISPTKGGYRIEARVRTLA